MTNDLHSPPGEALSAPAGPVSETASGPVYGFWLGLGIGILIILAGLLVQLLTAVVYIVTASLLASRPWLAIAGNLVEDGLFINLSVVTTALATIPLTIVAIRLRSGATVRDYLSLQCPALTTLLAAIFLTPLMYVGISWAGYLAQEPELNTFMIALYKGTPLALVFLAICVAGPVSEEWLFRGFLFRTFRGSVAGTRGIVLAILLPTLLWTLLHTQYSLVQNGLIFLVGIYLSLLRLFSGSLWPSILAHVLYNLMAVFHLMYAVSAFSKTGGFS